MKKVIVIVGPTAVGKSEFAIELAKKLSGEIISGDSIQVYEGLDIGSGKVTIQEMDGVPHHLIDIYTTKQSYTVADFQAKARDLIDNSEKPMIICGGTGLYIEAVLKGYSLSPVPQNPRLRTELEGKNLEELTNILVDLKRRNHSVMHNKTDVDSCQRAIRAIEIETYNLTKPTEERQCPPIDSLIIGVDIEREARREKITHRLKTRLEGGMVDEIDGLLKRGIPAEDLIYYGLEYKFVTEYLIGKLSYDEMFQQLEIAIHQFAKRQMTWFRGMERRGFTIHWVNAARKMEEKVEEILKLW